MEKSDSTEVVLANMVAKPPENCRRRSKRMPIESQPSLNKVLNVCVSIIFLQASSSLKAMLLLDLVGHFSRSETRDVLAVRLQRILDKDPGPKLDDVGRQSRRRFVPRPGFVPVTLCRHLLHTRYDSTDKLSNRPCGVDLTPIGISIDFQSVVMPLCE
jgi:hypothetical protein